MYEQERKEKRIFIAIVLLLRGVLVRNGADWVLHSPGLEHVHSLFLERVYLLQVPIQNVRV